MSLNLNQNLFKCKSTGAEQYLWTPEVFEKLKNQSKESTIAVVKFFLPYASWTWYITELLFTTEDDIILFGLCDGLCKELGSISLKEIHAIPVKFDLGVERDIFFDDTNVAEL